MGGELAEAAALHARLMVEQQVTDLYTGDCRGCGECCSRFLPMSLLDRARLRAYVRRHGVAAHAPGLATPIWTIPGGTAPLP